MLRTHLARSGYFLAASLLLAAAAETPACILRPTQLHYPLAGQLVDYTANWGVDRRIDSKALGRKADLYVYLPPKYDKDKAYPLVIYLHGGMQDERDFPQVAYLLDQQILCGNLPPVIVAAPDGSVPCTRFGSFFINSDLGKYEDFVISDVYGFLKANYKIRPEPEAHCIVGASMGGFGAYSMVLKHRAEFKTVAAVLPPLNLRWTDKYGNYFAPFNPYNWGWREYPPHPAEVIGAFGPLGIIKVRAGDFYAPLFGYGPDAIAKVSAVNPIELLHTLDVKKGEVAMYVGYAGRDEFNLAAQAESFLYVARDKGLDVAAHCLPGGKHDQRSAILLLPSAVEFLRQRLEPYK